MVSSLTLPVFGSLVLGTGSLGIWQTARYFDKVALIESQAAALSDDDVDDESRVLEDPRIKRVVTMTGTFLHGDEVMVGPRGPPPGVLSSDGPMSGRGGGGISSSPQGYYVLTPFEKEGGGVVLVNRGWSYKSPRSSGHDCDWPRRGGPVRIKAVTQGYESGGYFAPPPVAPSGLGSRAPTLFLWMQEEALKAETGCKGDLVKQIEEEEEVPQPSTALDSSPEAKQSRFSRWFYGTGLSEPPIFGSGDLVPPRFSSSSSSSSSSSKEKPLHRPDREQAVEFKVGPETHAGYAATWFALSGAGAVMTRNLLRKMPK